MLLFDILMHFDRGYRLNRKWEWRGKRRDKLIAGISISTSISI